MEQITRWGIVYNNGVFQFSINPVEVFDVNAIEMSAVLAEQSMRNQIVFVKPV